MENEEKELAKEISKKFIYTILRIICTAIIFFLLYVVIHYTFNKAKKTFNEKKTKDIKRMEEIFKRDMNLNVINKTEDNDNYVFIYIDKETGVNYIIYMGYDKAGICPRYNQDGSIYISK